MSVADRLVDESTPAAPGGACPVGPTARSFNPLASPNFADLHPLLANARRETPVLFSEELHMWVVTRYDDALEILRDPDTFSSSTRPVILSQFVDEARSILEDTHTFAAPNMGFDGRPDHDRLRRPVSGYFSAKGVSRLEPRIRELASQQLDQIPATCPADLMDTFARPLASRIILEIAGLPLDDFDLIMRYHDSTAAFFFGAPSPEVQVPLARDVKEWENYLVDFVAERQRQPQDDLTSHLLGKIARGEAEYTPEEVISFVSFDIVTVGVRPTAFAIVNLCRELLLHERRYWGLLRDDPTLFDNVFNESLRRSALSIGVFRQATRDVEINGSLIPKGSVVWVLICSTSRDEKQFADADAFDPHRPNLGSSLHFSHGLHYCLGSVLARGVTRIGLEVLMDRYPSLRLVPDQSIEFEPSINLMVPKTMLVEW